VFTPDHPAADDKQIAIGLTGGNEILYSGRTL
jgi:hypothetical protein